MDCDICSSCGEHAGWEDDEETGECVSDCCSAPPVNMDPDIDTER